MAAFLHWTFHVLLLLFVLYVFRQHIRLVTHYNALVGATMTLLQMHKLVEGRLQDVEKYLAQETDYMPGAKGTSPPPQDVN